MNASTRIESRFSTITASRNKSATKLMHNVIVYITSPKMNSTLRRATIRDVAERAKVSVATVSRVLNGSDLVTGATADSVRSAAEHLGFRLNSVGRSLRSTKTQTIGVILPTLTHPVFAECLQALEKAAAKEGYGISFATTDYDPANEERASELLLRNRVDGLILTVANAHKSKLLEKLDREAKPYVLVYNSPTGAAKHRASVGVDNRLAARQIAEHIIANDHQHIRMVSGLFAHSDRARLRARGFSDAIERAGLRLTAPIEVDFMRTDVRTRLYEALNEHPSPTAFFCSSDQLALRVIHALRSLGLRVPEDASVAGFDGVSLGEWLTPALTTVVQPTIEIAETAFTLLKSLIDGERYLGSAKLHHTLRLGGTVAPHAVNHVPSPRKASS